MERQSRMTGIDIIGPLMFETGWLMVWVSVLDRVSLP